MGPENHRGAPIVEETPDTRAEKPVHAPHHAPRYPAGHPQTRHSVRFPGYPLVLQARPERSFQSCWDPRGSDGARSTGCTVVPGAGPGRAGGGAATGWGTPLRSPLAVRNLAAVAALTVFKFPSLELSNSEHAR